MQRHTLTKHLASEKGTVDSLLAFMALILISIGFGMTIILPIAFDHWLKPTVEQDPRVTSTVQDFFRAGSNTISPVPACSDPALPECATTYSDKIRRLYRAHPIVQGEPVVECGVLTPDTSNHQPIDPRVTRAIITATEMPGLVILEDQPVGCHVLYQRFQTGAFSLVKTLMGDTVATYEGRADSAFNSQIT